MGFFLKKLIESYIIIALHCPIFNVDESGMTLDHSKLNVICQMGIKQLYRIIGVSGLIVPQQMARFFLRM